MAARRLGLGGIGVQDYGADTYGDRWAELYDAWAEGRFSERDTSAAVDVLAELAPSGRALELGIGTGRIALPLAERGLDVHGIDASAAMVAKLRDKPGGEELPVTLGDFADVDVEGTFDLVFVVFNTFFALSGQEAQVRCFANVAARLDRGVFLMEAFVPDVARFEADQTVRAVQVTTEQVDLEVSRHDRIAQTVDSQYMMLTEAGVRMQPIHLRYAWPSELDLMARLAGLRLRDRWGGWDRSPFTAASGAHISLYSH
jgi:SAM-dependent methyltransferase